MCSCSRSPAEGLPRLPPTSVGSEGTTAPDREDDMPSKQFSRPAEALGSASASTFPCATPVPPATRAGGSALVTVTVEVGATAEGAGVGAGSTDSELDGYGGTSRRSPVRARSRPRGSASSWRRRFRSGAGRASSRWLRSLDCASRLSDHQLDTARTVLRQMHGRAILADEVGLGKTIEAGLRFVPHASQTSRSDSLWRRPLYHLRFWLPASVRL